MKNSAINRLVLLGLLPIIALALYLEGQTYDPALIRFTLSEIGQNREASFFPDAIEGFNRSGQVRFFARENLYEYVNGHAEYFLSAGFIRLAVGEYLRTGMEDSEPDVVIDIYDMGQDIQAFGVFADESREGSSPVQVGMLGAKTDQGVNFVDGQYFVKIIAFRDTIPIDLFAERIDEMIKPVSEDIALFSRLPALGDILETRYIKEAYRGLAFANNVIERSYSIQGGVVQVSLLSGSYADMKNLLQSYLVFFRDSDINHVRMRKNEQEFFKVMDPYEGDWYLIPMHEAIFGIYGSVNDETLDRLLPLIMTNPQRSNK